VAKQIEQRQSRFRQLLDQMQGRTLEPDEMMKLFSELLAQIRSEQTGEKEQKVVSRYTEAQNAYLFLEYYQSILQGKVQLVLTEKMSESAMSLLSIIADVISHPDNYELSKQRWWGRTVNRPNRAETQLIRDATLNSSNASYVEKYDFLRSAQWLAHEDMGNMDAKNQVISAYVYEYLRALAVVRREAVLTAKPAEEVSLPFASLKEKKRYTIVIHNGPLARKVSVPAELLTDQSRFLEFHAEFRKCFTQTTAKLEQLTATEWANTSTTVNQAAIQKASGIGLSGSEDLQQARKRRDNIKDITAADLSITIARSDEMTLNQLQQDYRSDTYGTAIPITLTFGIDQHDRLTGFATKHAHPYTDGAYAVEETKRVTDTVFNEHMTRGLSTFERSVRMPPYALPKEQRRTLPIISEKVISREKFMPRITAVREYFRDHKADIQRRDPRLTPDIIDGIAQGMNIQNLLSLAIMVGLRLPHAHFLENVDLRDTSADPRAAVVAPAIAVLSPDLGKRIALQPRGPLNEDIFLDLITALSALDGSRSMTRKGKGPAHVIDTILGPKRIKESMQGAGSVLDAQKAKMLTDSTLISTLVRGSKPWESTNEFISMQGFTTAAADTYTKGVAGACDRKNPQTGKAEILVTWRRRQGEKSANQPVEDKGLELLEVIMHRILLYFEGFMHGIPFHTMDQMRPTIMKRSPELDARIREAMEKQKRSE
jgi:hypothetical protein